MLGLAVGCVVVALAGFLYLRSDAGQSALRDYLVAAARERAADTQPNTETPGGSTAATTSAPIGFIPVPKLYATEGYFSAITNVVADIDGLNAVNGELAPILKELNQKTISCTFGGF